MQKCVKCGNENELTAVSCAACGNTLPTECDDKRITAKNRILSSACYISFLWIVPLAVYPTDDEKMRFHINQGIILFIFGSLFVLLNQVITYIYNYIIEFILLFNNQPSSGMHTASLLVMRIVHGVFYFCDSIIIVFAFYGILNAFRGKQKSIPLLGKIRIY